MKTWVTLALVLAGCGGRATATSSTSPGVVTSGQVIGNSADADGPRRGALAEQDLEGEWIDEVGTSFWFERGDDGEPVLTQAGRFDAPETGTTRGKRWLRYSTGDESTVTITLQGWDDDLGGYRCTWDNGSGKGRGTLRPRAVVDEDPDGDPDDEGGDPDGDPDGGAP